MKQVLVSAATVLLFGALVGCGGTGARGAGAAGPTGEVHLNLNGAVSVNGPMAYIAIQNVFDPSQVQLVTCNEKPHTLNGEPFCDELTVLPPGVYEIIVQSTDPNCHPEQDHYKVVVKPNETTEVTINLVCGGANGGLDVIVRRTEPPIIDNIDFTFPNGDTANKYICEGGAPVTATVTVSDSDTACAVLQQAGNFSWLVNGVDGTPPPFPIISTSVSGGLPLADGGTSPCQFSATFATTGWAAASYDITLQVSDGTYHSSFSFPIHLISCGDAGTALPDAGL